MIKFLFVGTKAHDPKNEAKKIQFNFKEAGNYGNAVYCYETVNQANADAYPNPSSDPRQLLLCAVLVGESVYVETNVQMNQAPERPNGTAYDSVRNQDSSMFVVYEPSKVYPLYLVHYN